MLVVTSLEDGVPVAGKLAQAFPMGQLATLSFVILFGQLCPSLGVTIALLVGYIAAVLTLGIIEWISRIKPAIRRTANNDDSTMLVYARIPLGTT